MALLDMQGMELKTARGGHGGCGGHGGGGGGSELSLLLCDSVASITLCL
jgi:Lanthionine-containing peptide SapB precursor RamS